MSSDNFEFGSTPNVTTFGFHIATPHRPSLVLISFVGVHVDVNKLPLLEPDGGVQFYNGEFFMGIVRWLNYWGIPLRC